MATGYLGDSHGPPAETHAKWKNNQIMCYKIVSGNKPSSIALHMSKTFVQHQLSKTSGLYNERYSKIPYLERGRVVIAFSHVRYSLVTWFLYTVHYTVLYDNMFLDCWFIVDSTQYRHQLGLPSLMLRNYYKPPSIQGDKAPQAYCRKSGLNPRPSCKY